MSRLIDADILLERLEKKRKECNKEVKENENKSLELYIACARREGVLWAYAEVMSLIKESE